MRSALWCNRANAQSNERLIHPASKYLLPAHPILVGPMFPNLGNRPAPAPDPATVILDRPETPIAKTAIRQNLWPRR